jgi:hypothetical protein
MTPKKLQRNADRIGGHGIDFWRNGSGVIVRGVVDHGGISQNSHQSRNRSGVGSDNQQEDGHTQDYMEHMKALIERRETELASWIIAQSNMHQSVDGSPRLGPEGTILITESASSYGGDTDIETDGEGLVAPEHQNLQALVLEPTIIAGRSEPATSPLGFEPTELVSDVNYASR